MTSKDQKEDDNRDDSPTLPRVEVIRRLREKLQPILLFGENEVDACERLRQIEADAPEPSAGYTNDFKEASDRVDQVYLQEMLKSQVRPIEKIDFFFNLQSRKKSFKILFANASAAF